MEKRRYLLTGGGTGGHVYPAIAIADELRRREPDAEFLYVGVKGKAEEKIAPKRGYPIRFVSSEGWPGARPSLSLLRFAWRLGIGVIQAILILRQYKPHAIIATGGYVSAPIMLAWVLLRKLRLTQTKAFVHEQNLMPGRLNLLIGKLADRTGVSFEESRRYLPQAEAVGYPVRKEMVGVPREEARKRLGLPEDARVLLAFGGSQGARTINRALVDALPQLLQDPNIWVIHGVGRLDSPLYRAEKDTQDRLAQISLTEEQRKRYQMFAYLDPIEDYYAAADLVIGRGGAGTLTEMAVCGLAALIIPKANLPGDHQVRNARALQDGGAAEVVYEHAQRTNEGLIDVVAGEELASAVAHLLGDTERLKKMREAILNFGDVEALGRIVDRVQQLATGRLEPLPSRPVPKSDGPVFAEMTGGGLVSYLGRHGLKDIPARELEYLTYRTDGYLSSDAWQTRNVGVKLVGLLQLHDHLELILYILQDKTPASRLHRLLGGDYRQVGFIRRNAFQVLRQLNVWNPQVRETLLLGFEDPYFEVRSNAAQTAIFFSEQIGDDPEILAAIRKLMMDRDFEVAREGILAMGHFAKNPDVYEAMRALYTHPNWRLREAVVLAMTRLVERGVLAPEKVAEELDQFLLTSIGFAPRFHLREKMLHLSQTLQKVKNAVPPQ
ncbi:MAG: glycosyltransferase [Myxococcales bacterium]|nr:glycosyltransferase [Myxococcales bacterium]MCB9642902.1 glycosyltransferase [Myxococcales bacterium]